MPVDIFGRPSGGSGLMGPPGPPGPQGPKGHDGTLIDPTSSYETYVNFINLRKKSGHSIRGIVKIKGNQTVYTGYIDYLLEVPTLHNVFYWTSESFKDKYIELIQGVSKKTIRFIYRPKVILFRRNSKL